MIWIVFVLGMIVVILSCLLANQSHRMQKIESFQYDYHKRMCFIDNEVFGILGVDSMPGISTRLNAVADANRALLSRVENIEYRLESEIAFTGNQFSSLAVDFACFVEECGVELIANCKEISDHNIGVLTDLRKQIDSMPNCKDMEGFDERLRCGLSFLRGDIERISRELGKLQVKNIKKPPQKTKGK